MTSFYLGVDGGQSSTTALIANESGRIIGHGRSGPCNHVSAGEAVKNFRRVLGECIRMACENAGLSPSDVSFRAACLGLSGGPEDKEAHVRAIVRSDKVKITNDAEIALSGATAGEPGIIVIAGTGSIALGRNGSGRMARAGGWGYVFGDEGGGFDLVRRALRAALRFEEGWGPGTILREQLLHLTGARTMNQALHLFYTPDYPKTRVASFSRIVDDAAVAGDGVSIQILQDAAHELSAFAEGVYRNLFEGSEAIAVAHVGGVFQSERLLRAFVEDIKARTGSVVIAPRFSPAAGAALEAMRLDGNHNLPIEAGPRIK